MHDFQKDFVFWFLSRQEGTTIKQYYLLTEDMVIYIFQIKTWRFRPAKQYIFYCCFMSERQVFLTGGSTFKYKFKFHILQDWSFIEYYEVRILKSVGVLYIVYSLPTPSIMQKIKA